MARGSTRWFGSVLTTMTPDPNIVDLFSFFDCINCLVTGCFSSDIRILSPFC